MDYEAGWSWANDRMTNYSPNEIRRDAESASIYFNDPDSFYEGVLDCIDKLKEELIS
jgi:hypothetical protein